MPFKPPRVTRMLPAVLACMLFVRVSASLSEEGLESVKAVTYGSTIKLEHIATKHRLHSHNVPYGSGSGQQSVTATMETGDSNSFWVVRHAHADTAQLSGTPVRCMQRIRLQHLNTGKNLHSHPHRAPLNADLEVSAYAAHMTGRWAVGDQGDDWIVECQSSQQMWLRFEHVRLRHVESNRFLVADVSLNYGPHLQNQLQVSACDLVDERSLWMSNEGFFMSAIRVHS